MRVLVTASSKHGATADIADAIAGVFEARGLHVTVKAPDHVRDIRGFDAFVVGSAVYAGRWMGEARTFVDRNAEALASHPTWLFSSGPIGDPPKPDAGSAVKLDDVIARTGAREHRLFPGRLDRRRLGLGERTVVRMVGAADGDYREWNDVAAWADTISEALRAAEAETVIGSIDGPAAG